MSLTADSNRTGEVTDEELKASGMKFTASVEEIRGKSTTIFALEIVLMRRYCANLECCLYSMCQNCASVIGR